MGMYDNQRDIASAGINQALDYWWSKKNIDLHTQIPARVDVVDFIKNTVTVTPLIKTFINNSQTLEFPQQADVPMSLLSNRSGNAKITIPVEVGDVGLLKFSERDITNWSLGLGDEVVDPLIKDNLSMGAKMYPVCFELGLFTPTSATEWDSVNIVIKNKLGLILVSPDGSVTSKNTKGFDRLEVDGSVNTNGCITSITGNVVTKNNTDLDQLKSDFEEFKALYLAHGHLGVTTGGGVSGGVTVAI